MDASRTSTQMLLQSTRLPERFLTYLTCKWSLPSMSTLMQLQGA